MSAFVNTQNHFEQVRTGLEHNYSKFQDRMSVFPHLFHSELNLIGMDEIYEEIEQLVKTWRELQIITVCHKYSHNIDEPIGKHIHKQLQVAGELQPAQKKLDRTELYKALQCVNYQIELEHMPRELSTDERQAMDILEKLLKGIPGDIVQDTDKYEQSNWAIA